MPKIFLKEVTKSNWYECINLKVSLDQIKFVASNLYSIAESKVDPSMIPRAIYNTEEIMVGFLMYSKDPETQEYWLVRMMIDEKYQHKGYGRSAVMEAINIMKSNPDCNEIVLGYKPENHHAKTLYKSLGFVETGEFVDGENIARLKL